MGFPRQKVKARRVAPSESGDERISKSFNGGEGSWLPDSNFRDQRVRTFLIQKKSLRQLIFSCQGRCRLTRVLSLVVFAARPFGKASLE
jgi:hypothetical protein